MIKLFLLTTFFVPIISATTLSNRTIQFNEEDIPDFDAVTEISTGVDMVPFPKN